MPTHSALLSLPGELLDLVLAQLCPGHNPSHDYPDDDEDIDWKLDYAALRQVCKLCSKLDAVNGPLFHDYTLYMYRPSIDRLAMFAQNERLRPFLRRIIFMQPQVNEIFTHEEHYQLWMGAAFHRHAQDADLDNALPYLSNLAKQLSWPMDKIRLHKGWSSYQLAERHVTEIVQCSTTMPLVRRSLRAFPNIRTAMLSSGTGAIPGYWKDETKEDVAERETFLERRYPDMMMKSATSSRIIQQMRKGRRKAPLFAQEPTYTIATTFLEKVTKLIADLDVKTLHDLRLARVRLLVQENECFGHAPKFQHLKHLHFEFGGDDPPWSSDTFRQNMDPVLRAIQANIETIKIRVAYPHKPECQVDFILAYDFPKLQKLSLMNFRLQGSGMEGFASRSRALKVLKLRWVDTAGFETCRNAFWELRKRKGLEILRFTGDIDGWDLGDMTVDIAIDTFADGSRPIDEEDIVGAFICGFTEWTDQLEAKYPAN